MTVKDYTDWLREMDEGEDERYNEMARNLGDDCVIVCEGRAALAARRAEEKVLREKRRLAKQQKRQREEDEAAAADAAIDIESPPPVVPFNYRTVYKYIALDNDSGNEEPRRPIKNNNNNTVISLIDDDDMVMDSPPPSFETEEVEAIDIEQEDEMLRVGSDGPFHHYHAQYIIADAFDQITAAEFDAWVDAL